MSHATAELKFNEEGFVALQESRNEPDWLRKLRAIAWESFLAKSWPDRRQEEWIRTDIRGFHLDKYSLPLERPAPLAELRPQLTEGLPLAGYTVSANSRSQSARLEPKWAAKGVLFGSLDELVLTHGDLIRRYLLNQAVDMHYDKFSALHAACWSGGTLLYVPAGVVIEDPFHVFSTMANGAADLGHLLVVLEDGAEATVITELASTGEKDTGFHCGATELIVKPTARLRCVNLQQWGQGVWHFAHQKAIVDRDASLLWTMGALGSRLSKVNQHVELIGKGAEAEVGGVMFTQESQHLSYHTLQHHIAPHCRSNFLYKNALQDRSRTVWRGMIKVDKAAQKTDGYQRNDNLLLSKHSRADAIPGLEIEADDVRCTHGSTTGRVDDELIFYAQSRGFTRQEAIRMIVTGFFQQVFDRVTIEPVREALSRTVARRVRQYE